MTQSELNQKLEELRTEWRSAGPGLRKLIKVRADLLNKRYGEQNNIVEMPATPELWKALQNETE